MDLSAYTHDGQIALISPPQSFEGGEEAYDQAIGGAARADLLRSGRGAFQLAARHALRPIRSVLEIGAGGGTCTLGLVAEAGQAELLVTDTSPEFLRMIARKLAAAGLEAARVRYATLAGEDLARLPDGAFDAVVIASALHHVGDWREFLRQAARALRPGGVLAIQEPCREGNLMMAMALDVALSPLWPGHAALQRRDVERLQRCRDSIYFLAASVPKVGEDKHSFLATELAAGGQQAGFGSSTFYANAHFQDLADVEPAQQNPCSFLAYFDSFLELHHRVSQDGMRRLRDTLFPILDRLDRLFQAGDGVPLLGCMIFIR